MRRKTFWLLAVAALLLMTVLFSACGAEAVDESQAPEVGGDNATISSGTVVEDRKIVITARYRIETLTFSETVDELEAAVAAAGGYISASTVRPPYDGSAGSADLTIRIPVTAADAFMTTLSGVGNVTSANVTKEDVTLTYDDVAARIAVLRAEQTKLLEFMDISTDVDQTLRIRERYVEISEELASYEKQMQSLENVISYATFSVTLKDVQSYSDGEENFLVRFGHSFGKSFRNFADVLGKILIVFVYLLPYLLVVGAVVTASLLLSRRRRRKKQAALCMPRPTVPAAEETTGTDEEVQ